MNEKTEHYFNEETDIPLRLGFLSGLIKGTLFEFYTSQPVFAWRKFDTGSINLAENMQIKATDKTLLDLGCGYGMIGIVAAYFNPNLNITLSDISNRAILLALKNVKRHHIGKRSKILQGNLYEPLKPKPPQNQKKTFDVIVSNPPYSAGKKVVNEIIEKALEHLNTGGNLQIVGRKSKGGEMYKQKMIEVFGNCEEFGINSGFRI
jgi:16S rRNA (guanine1207-N2)-methyltransferase